MAEVWFDKLPPDLQALVTADASKVARGGPFYELTPAQHERLHDTTFRTGDDATAGNPDFKAIYDTMVRASKKD